MALKSKSQEWIPDQVRDDGVYFGSSRMIQYSEQGFANETEETSFWRSLNSTILFHQERNPITNFERELRSLRRNLAEESDLTSRRHRVWCINLDRERRLDQPYGPASNKPPTHLNGGRLMAYFPDQDLCDGAAEDVSEGFFNVFNTPPHDLWVDLVEGAPDDRLMGDFLIAWVPKEYIELANEGMEVNPEECIIWLENHDHPLVDALRTFGLLSS